jgi:hypothetical protein
MKNSDLRKAWDVWCEVVGAKRALLFIGGLAMLACSGGGGGSVLAEGGMSGTGISQGSISSFGSIFVNGVEWDLSSASIELDGVGATEADLRLGMVVRVEGEYDSGNLTGSADRVVFDDSIEGPLENDPVETVPDLVKQFVVLGQTVFMNAETTVFENGASFAALQQDDVVEVSGFVDPAGAIQATRIELKGQFPGDDQAELRGLVDNLVTNPNGTGMFDLGPIVVHYAASTTFKDVTRATLMDGHLVEVEGVLRANGDEIDALEVELETAGLGSGDADRVELEGIVSNCVPNDFCVAGTPVDASGASFDPVGFMPVAGDEVEVEGTLVAGVIVADLVEDEADDRNVRIEAVVTSLNAGAQTLVILGVTVTADAETVLEDESSIDDENFTFPEIQPGNFLEIRAFDDGSTVRALSIRREDASAGSDDVKLEGPVTSLDTGTPALSILGQPIPLDAGTLYFDETETQRTEEEFFRNPGDVMLGDIVKATDASAVDLSVLSEADEVELEN